MRRKTAVMAVLAATMLGASPGWALDYTLKAKNNCSHDILVRGLDNSRTLLPDNQTLPAKTATKTSEISYTLPLPWIGGRVYGCWDASAAAIDIHDGGRLQQYCGLVEMTVSSATGTLSSNISFVDFISIPIQIDAAGTFCTNNGVSTAYFDPDAVIKGCPTKLLNNRVCMSANQYCSDASNGDPTSAYCKALDGVIAKCQADPKSYPGCTPGGDAHTADVYGCRPTTFWAGGGAGQQYCMAINRGILTDPKWRDIQGDPSKFYPAGGTYNTYAKFVHDTAGPIFALSYDDYPSHLYQGGYLNCQTSTSWTITFCPDKPPTPVALSSGAATGVSRSNKSDRLQLDGTFESDRDIDLRLESVRLEALLAEPGAAGDELVGVAGGGTGGLPLRLIRRAGAAEDNALFETPRGAHPQASLRISRKHEGDFAFSLIVSGAAIDAADACVGAPPHGASPAMLQTRFRLETAGVDVAAEEPWDCGNGQTYRVIR